jgi:hypothetical protein
MSLTEEQKKIVIAIDNKAISLIGNDCNDETFLAEMVDYMPDFHRLMTTTTAQEMEEIVNRYEGFYSYAKLLEGLAMKIRSGEVRA